MEELITSMQSVESPEPIIEDSRGTKIEVGARVAYNKSGSIQLGTIQKVKQNEWKKQRPGVSPNFWWGIKFQIIILNEDGTTLSTLKNPNSFIIL